MEKSRSSIQTPKLSNRHEAAIIEQIIHKRLYADVKSEGMECDIPSGSSCRDDGYSNLWNHDGARIKLFRGVFAPVNGPLSIMDKKQTALLYEDPRTGRSFRFLLHRKNTRKADIYTCAKCKSRRKYVRIMVQNDKFLSDPAALDHICYMNATELHEERIRLEKWKRRKRIKLPPGVSPIDVIEAETDFHPKYDSAISDEGTFVNSTSNSPKSPGTEDAPQAISLEELVSQADAMSEKGQTPSDASTAGSSHGRTSQASKDFHYQEIYRPIKEDAHSMMPRQCKEELQSSLPPQPKDECQSNRPSPKDELQTSEQEPSEPQSSAALRNEVCLESIKMALESIPPANRQKAHVDILRYVYTTIFDKYLL